MRFSRQFYRCAAVCSVGSAGTTLLLIFLPKFYGPATSFEHRLELIDHPLYQLRAWAYLLHPFMVLTASLGVAAALRRSASGAAVSGLLAFVLWGFTEAAQQALTLTAFHRCAAAYRTAEGAARETLRMQIATYDAVGDAMFLLLLLAFLAAKVLYGIATVRGRGLTRTLAVFYFGAAFLTSISISGELGGPTPPAFVTACSIPCSNHSPARQLASGCGASATPKITSRSELTSATPLATPSRARPRGRLLARSADPAGVS